MCRFAVCFSHSTRGENPQFLILPHKSLRPGARERGPGGANALDRVIYFWVSPQTLVLLRNLASDRGPFRRIVPGRQSDAP